MGAIRRAKFRDYSRKVVVLLGDMGNNTAWDTKQFPGPTVADIAAALNPAKRSPILFFPFQVDRDPTKEADLKEYKLAGAQGLGGSRVQQHWDLAEEKNQAKKVQGEEKVIKMVIGKWKPTEEAALKKVLKKVVEAAELFASEGVEAATELARANGLAIPAGAELSDLELELVAGGKRGRGNGTGPGRGRGNGMGGRRY